MPNENLRCVPVYQKALALCEISSHFASYVSFNKDLMKLYESNSLRDNIADSLLIDTHLIPQKIAQVESSTSTSERINTATFINIMIQNLNSYCLGLEKDGLKEVEYLNLLRIEILSFSESFRKWSGSLPNAGYENLN